MDQLIDPRALARVKDMPLIAKTVAEGFLHGHHASVQRGVGIEFTQFRPYNDGDDLSRIDWKLFARSDRYYIRESERESESDVWFVLDASASMAVQRARGAKGTPIWSKLDYSKHLIATLAYLANRQGDQFGLMAFGSDTPTVMPLGTGERHWSALLLALSRIKSGDAFPKRQLVEAQFSKLQKPAMIIFLSDFYEHDAELLDFVQHIKTPKTDLSALNLANEDEVNFPYRGATRFRDAETGKEVLVSAGSVRSQYRAAFAQHRAELEQQMHQRAIPLRHVNVDAPMDQTLYDFLRDRMKVGQS